jgi:hypothetical protein
MQIKGELTGIVAGGEQIQMALKSPADGIYGNWAHNCAAGSAAAPATCVTPVESVTAAGTGNWYVEGEWVAGGVYQQASANSPVIYYPGL